jgi:hypothetical protein
MLCLINPIKFVALLMKEYKMDTCCNLAQTTKLSNGLGIFILLGLIILTEGLINKLIGKINVMLFGQILEIC